MNTEVSFAPRRGWTPRDKILPTSGRTSIRTLTRSPRVHNRSSSMPILRSQTAGAAASTMDSWTVPTWRYGGTRIHKAYVWAIETITPGSELTVRYGPDYWQEHFFSCPDSVQQAATQWYGLIPIAGQCFQVKELRRLRSIGQAHQVRGLWRLDPRPQTTQRVTPGHPPGGGPVSRSLTSRLSHCTPRHQPNRRLRHLPHPCWTPLQRRPYSPPQSPRGLPPGPRPPRTLQSLQSPPDRFRRFPPPSTRTLALTPLFFG